MAGSTAEISWVSNDQAVLRSFEKVERNLDNMARKLDKVEQSSRKTAQTTQTGFAAAAKTLADFAGAVTGIGSVIGGISLAAAQVRREWEELKRQQQGAADANLQLAQVLPQTVRNSGGLLSAREVEGAVSRISRNTGVSEVNAARALGDALSARGATRKSEALEAVGATEAALRYAPELDASSAAALAGGAIDITRRFKVSPEQAIGFISRVGAQSRVVDLRNLIQNVSPALGNVTSFGGTAAEAGALVSVLTSATGDFTGASTGTAAIQLGGQLNKFGFENWAEGVRALQADPAMRAKFLKGASFEAKAAPAIKALLTAGTPEAEGWAAAAGAIGTFDQGATTYRQQVAEINSLQSVRLANLKRGLSQAAGSLRLGNVVGAEGHITREAYAELLAASGAGALEQSFLTTEFDLATGGGTRTRAADLAAALRRRARAITATTQMVSGGVGGRGVEVPRQVSGLEMSQGATLRDVADLLQQLVNETKDQTSEMKSPSPTQRALPSAALRR